MAPSLHGTENSPRSFIFLKNDAGGLCPHEGFWGGIVLVEIVMDGGLQLRDALEDAAPDALAGDLGEEALDEVQPGRRSWNEVQREAWMPLQPCFHLIGLVGCVVVDDEMEVGVSRNAVNALKVAYRGSRGISPRQSWPGLLQFERGEAEQLRFRAA